MKDYILIAFFFWFVVFAGLGLGYLREISEDVSDINWTLRSLR